MQHSKFVISDSVNKLGNDICALVIAGYETNYLAPPMNRDAENISEFAPQTQSRLDYIGTL